MQERLRFIDFVIDFYGTLQRAAIMDFFGISIQQASHDIRAYHQAAPDNLRYDMTAKLYRRGPDYKRIYP